MAIYHATTKPISRSSGRSATASAAYRAGVEIKDERTGLTHDYSKRGGVLLATVFDKDDNEIDRSELWNLAEQAEKRKDARTAREWIVAIPSELMPEYPEQLSDDERRSTELLTDYQLRKEFAEHHAKDFSGTQTALDFGKMLSKKYGVAVDVAIHAPDEEGSNKNYHAHIMTTTRKFSIENGQMVLGDKTSIELSNKKLDELKLPKTQDQVKELRAEWAKIANQALERNGFNERIDHRSYAERGIEQLPTQKLGWKASAMERRGLETDRGDINRAINADNLQIKGLALEIRIDTNKMEEQKQALEFQQGMDALRAKQEAQAKAQAKAEQARPKTAKEFVERLSQEQRQKVKEISNKTISQYSADINSRAVELYEKATPANRRAKPLFAHYAYSDMKEVQPYKSLAQREIHEKDPSRYKDYAKAIEITNAMQDMERREGYQRQAERTREPSQDKGIGR